MQNYKFKPQNSSWYTRAFEWFRPNYWITLGSTIYHPSGIDPEDPKYSSTIEHEKVHVRQMNKYGLLLFLILYVCIPIPLIFSYFRWKFEREAYMVTILSFPKHRRLIAAEQVVDILWNKYFWTWPKSWMRKWFLEQLRSENE